MNHAASLVRTNPFPGLRPFREDEEYLFFGRENQVDAMVDKLADTHFLAVVGTSGSGKSSLVNCGLRPALRRGLMARAGTAWRMAQFRPGNDPIRALARALAKDGVLFPKDAAEGLPLAEIIETTLRMSKLGLVDMFEQARLDEGVNLLVVVDQFEEMFRYRQLEAAAREGDQRPSEEAAALVNLLLEVEQVTCPIFVVLTMRSDFLGDCTQFPGLAEAVNAGQYLVPRMTRDERRAAIEGPARVGDAEITPILLTRLVNDVGDNPDQLSILQHALNRTWARWQEEGCQGPLDLADYEAVGTMTHALDQHAEQAYSDLGGARAQKICEKLFKALTDKATDPRGIRRPTALRILCALADATEAEVAEVINVFRDPGRSFLMPPADEALGPETVIDISHESLMRVWRRLNAWADEEAQSARRYRRLTDTATLHATGAASLWRDPDLQLALDWRDKNQPNEAWASRYNTGFAAAMGFITQSSEAREAEWTEQRERRQRELAAEQEKAKAKDRYARRMRWAALSSGALALVAVIAACAAGWAFLRESAMQRMAIANKSRALTALSEAARLQGHYADAVKLALAAWPRSAADQRPLLRQTIEALAQALAGLLPISPPLPHGGKVFHAAFSPNGARVVTASADRTARVWDAETGTPIGQPLPHQGDVVGAAFSPDGARVVTASADKTARVWDAATGAPIGKPLEHDGKLNGAAFSPDGKRVVTAADDHTARVWDVETGARIGQPLRHAAAVYSASFSPDGKWVVTASGDHTARLWDSATGAPIGKALQHNGRVYRAAFSSDGARVVTASADNTARVWDAATGSPIGAPMQHDNSVYDAEFSPDGERIVTASIDDTARVWDAATGKPVANPMRHRESVNSAAFSPDGTRVVTASDDNTGQVWDAATGAPVGKPLQHDDAVLSAAFGPRGGQVVTASADKTARVWNDVYGKELQHNDRVLWAAFSPDGKRVVTASADMTARIWDGVSGAPIGQPLQHRGLVYDASFSPDGSRVVTASQDKTAQVWDAATGAPIGQPLRHNSFVYSAAFSPDGARIATASSDNTARVWDAATGAPIGRPMQHDESVNSAAFSPDGARVVTASDDDTARVWDAATGVPIGQPLRHDGQVYDAAFSPDGKRVVTASHDKTARVWDAASGAPIGKPLQHRGLVYRASFSPDGARVVTASSDNSARVWDAATGTPVGVPLRHDDRVSSAAFSSDGRRVVTASADDTARVWDAASGAPIGNPILHLGPVHSAALSPDGARVLSASDDKTGRISPTPRVDPNIFATACKTVGDHDTTNLLVRYGVDIVDPICQPSAPVPQLSRMIDR